MTLVDTCRALHLTTPALTLDLVGETTINAIGLMSLVVQPWRRWHPSAIRCRTQQQSPVGTNAISRNVEARSNTLSLIANFLRSIPRCCQFHVILPRPRSCLKAVGRCAHAASQDLRWNAPSPFTHIILRAVLEAFEAPAHAGDERSSFKVVARSMRPFGALAFRRRRLEHRTARDRCGSAAGQASQWRKACLCPE